MGGGRGLAVVALSACIASACAPGGGIVAQPSPSGPAPALTETVIQSGLIVPWDVAVAADGRMFVTERPGTISVFESTMPMAKRIATTQVAGIHAMGEAGLLGIALDPDFTSNQLLYVCASRTDQGGEWRNQVLRYRVAVPALALEVVVLRTGPMAGGVHDACRLRFGPDRKLWIATGDGGVAAHAQDAASLNGKVLRINTDGSVPYDNPTLKGQTGPTAVYALGLRNPGGLAFHPTTGACYVTDAGDQMQDEIDLVTSGANFGWPGALGPGGVRRGFDDPLWSSGTASYAVAGAVFLSGSAWGSWSESLIVATLKEHDLRRFTVEGSRVLAREVLVDDRYGRLRGLAESSEGALIVTTSNGSGDRIVRIAPTR